MSSEKPFWEGKTCEEMANLHVKVTFVAGAVLTGITDCSGHIRRSRNGSVVPISANRGAERFVPYRDIEMPPRNQDMTLPPADRNRIWYMSGKDRANNRSKTPLGFARAVYETNHKEENR